MPALPPGIRTALTLNGTPFPLEERGLLTEPVRGQPTQRRLTLSIKVRLEPASVAQIPAAVTAFAAALTAASRFATVLPDGTEEVVIDAVKCVEPPETSWQLLDPSIGGLDRLIDVRIVAAVIDTDDDLLEWEQTVELMDAGPMFEPVTFAGLPPVLVRGRQNARVLNQRGSAVGRNRQPKPPPPVVAGHRLDVAGPRIERIDAVRLRTSWNYVLAVPADAELPLGATTRPATPEFYGDPAPTPEFYDDPAPTPEFYDDPAPTP